MVSDGNGDRGAPRRPLGHTPPLLSPNEFRDMTRLPDLITADVGDTWALHEQRVKIRKKGVRLHGLDFVAVELLEHVADPNYPGPEIVARFDLAEAAAGTLKWIDVLVKEKSRYTYVARAWTKHEYRRRSPERYAKLQQRWLYEAGLLDTREHLQDRYWELEDPVAAEEGRNQVEGRRRGAKPPKPQRAQGIGPEVPETDQEREHRQQEEEIRAALAERDAGRDEAQEPAPDSEHSTDPEAYMRARLKERQEKSTQDEEEK